jgi:hypothetical protein
MTQRPKSTDVILMKVGDHRSADVARGVAQLIQSGTERFARADFEAGQTVIKYPGDSSGEIIGVRNGGAILSEVKQHNAFTVLNDIDVDWPRSRPLLRSEQPP